MNETEVCFSRTATAGNVSSPDEQIISEEEEGGVIGEVSVRPEAPPPLPSVKGRGSDGAAE